MATRDHLLDTAERVFQRHGVSRTSLAELASAAGVTRGAIYWHFQDKSDLFNAMMRRVSLPMEEALERCSDVSVADPLAQMRSAVLGVFEKLVNDPQVRRVFEVVLHKVEYVDELSAVRARHLDIRNACVANFGRVLAVAIERGQLGRRLEPTEAAIGLHALVDGLIHNWIFDPQGFDLVKVGARTLDAYLAGLGPVASSRSRQCSRTP